MKVAKFGGTSLANAKQIKKVCEIIRADRKRRLIVVSAPGKRDKEDQKVTDLLICYAEAFLRSGAAEAEKQAVFQRYREIVLELGLSRDLEARIEADLEQVLTNQSGLAPERFIDAVKAAGEDNCAKVVAAYLRSLGEDAHYLSPREAGLLVTGSPGNAYVLAEAYERLASLRQREGIVVFPGFFGFTEAGELITFARGGSDITGSILAAAVKAEVYENFTDVDSVYVVNPNLVKHPKEIKEITYREMRELAYSGFSVFHEEALIPAYQANIPVCVKNTNNPAAPGTMIVSERAATASIVSGIACDSGFCIIFVSKFLMHKEIGFGRKLLQILEEEGISYEHTPSGIDNISVILRERDLTPDKEARISGRIRTELQVDDLAVQHGLALVMIVGEGMRQSVGTSARATAALAAAKINLEMINQGSSEVSMMFGVKAAEADRAVIALYEEFFGEGTKKVAEQADQVTSVTR